MNDTGSACDQRDRNEEDAMTIEVSDETLEAAACTPRQQGAAYTIVMCTGGLECPF
jgi:hypothetical protein